MQTKQTERTNGTGAEAGGEVRTYAPRLAFYRANGQGTGAVAQFNLKLERASGERGGNCLFLAMARQMAAEAPVEGGRGTSRFDWQNKASVKLDFFDASEILAVLEGRQPSAGGEKGIYHESRGMNTIISFKRREDGGYWLGLSRRDEAKQPVFKAQIGMSDAEGVGLRCALQGVMSMLAFFPFERPEASGAGASERTASTREEGDIGF